MSEFPTVKPVRTFSVFSIFLTGLLVAILWMGTVWWVHDHNPRALFSTHGLLHSAVVQQIGLDSLPPENPFYANQPVCYYWFFHAVGAVIVYLTGSDPLHALEGIIIASLLMLFVAATVLGARMYASRVAGVFMGCLALIGGNPLGPVIWLVKRGLEGADVFNPDPEAVFGSYIYRSQIGQRLFGPNWPYFFNITSRPVALALILVILLALHRFLRNHRGIDLCFLLLSTFLATAMNPIVGGAAAIALAAALVMESFLWKGCRTSGTWSECVKQGLRPAVLLGLGVLLSVPTFWSMLEYGQGGTRFVLFKYLGLKSLVAIGIGAGPILCLTLCALRRRHAEYRFQFICALAAGMLLLGAIAIDLPVENTCNLYHVAVVLLACPAATLWLEAQVPSGVRSRWHRQLFWIALLPAAVLVANAYSGRAPLDAGFGGGKLLRLPLDSDISRLYQWLQTQTPIHAVMVTDPRERVALTGNVSELPAFTRRVMFVGSGGYMTDPYSDAGRRRSISVNLVSANPLTKDDDEFLTNLGRPVYVVLENGVTDERLRVLAARYGAPAFHTGTAAVFRWNKH